jgi:hypothetical protein
MTTAVDLWAGEYEDEKQTVEREVVRSQIGMAPRSVDETSVLATMMSAAVTIERIPAEVIKRGKQIGGLLGDDGYYRFPAGKDKATGETKFIEGASIDLAQALAQAWGAITYQVRIIATESLASGGQRVHLRAIVADLKAIVAAEVDQVVSTAPPPGKFADKIEQRERWHAMQVQSAASKIVRNAILRVLPEWYVGPALREAFRIGALRATGGKPLTEARKLALDTFAPTGLLQPELEKFVGQPVSMWAAPQLGDLRALFRDLQDGLTSVEQVRAGLAANEQSATAPAEKSTLGLGAKKPVAAVVQQPAQPANEAADASEVPDRRAPENGAEKRTRAKGPDFVTDGDAWVAHLKSLEDERDVAKEWNAESGRFRQKGVFDARRLQVIADISRRLPEADPERVLANALAR